MTEENIGPAPTVFIQEGPVRGLVSTDVRGGKFYSFLGIPYAKPPVGPLRFKAPVPVDPWLDTFDATQPGEIAIQADFLTKGMVGCEDCLNLNVYTPQLPAPVTPKRLLKPVMVFIHGGSFLLGSNRRELHGPEILISEDVVLVAINYRLGVFGFLSLEDPKLDVPGNAALKDMVLALKWVQRNIQSFMGDPRNVTIFGNSAGAAAVHFLVLSPMAKGLFSKAICQSGSALSSWAYAHQNAQTVAEALALPYTGDRDLYNCLKGLKVEDIFQAQSKIDQESIKCNQYRFIGAVVEPPDWRGPKFFSEHPVRLLLSGKYNKVPLLMGYNSGDGMIVDGMVEPHLNYIYWTEKEYNVPGLLHLEKGSALSRRLGDEIVSFYFGNGPISRDTHLRQFYDITTDNSFLRGIFSSVQHHLRTSNCPIYMYRLSLDSDLCFYKRMLGIELPGVCHADEIGYLFSTLLTSAPEAGSVEDVAQRRMCRLWANFAKYSNPTPVLDPLLEITWPPVADHQNVAFLDICQELKVEFDPEPERMKFWERIYSEGLLVSKL
ncbi:esterase B1-like [Dendroctonus ponderosae]|uniref:Carboxylesterase type B domain-containing protein n=4 Tax=Dendroctonus ponderosae TaxID=77166 RepID=A0AAR5QFU5_DENPD|nr:esterase B1-like [Dendroctonus ponderosae]